MSKKQATSGWHFNLESVGKSQGLRDPLGYKSTISDMVVRNSGKKTTQIEVLENVVIDCFNLIYRKLGNLQSHHQSRFS